MIGSLAHVHSNQFGLCHITGKTPITVKGLPIISQVSREDVDELFKPMEGSIVAGVMQKEIDASAGDKDAKTDMGKASHSQNAKVKPKAANKRKRGDSKRIEPRAADEGSFLDHVDAFCEQLTSVCPAFPCTAAQQVIAFAALTGNVTLDILTSSSPPSTSSLKTRVVKNWSGLRKAFLILAYRLAKLQPPTVYTQGLIRFAGPRQRH